jgi:riboflavin kinase / FMN adenylyltransferase
VNAVEFGEEKVSSSIIRTLLFKGEVKKAGQLLCMPYEISGSVIRGNQIGRRLGYPTANLYIEDPHKLIPSMGVYAALVKLRNQTYKAMANIGIRPTINAHQLTIEANIFDFDEDIYYEKITIKLIDRIRDERKYNSLDVLKEQLWRDKQDTISILKNI